MYSKKLIQSKKLKKFWVFFSGNLKTTFKINYLFINNLYNNGCFTDLKILVLFIKRLLPLFFNISKNEGNVLLVASRFLYSKIIFKNTYKVYGKELIQGQPGVLSNFSTTSYSHFQKLDFKTPPSVLIFFNFVQNNYLLKEGKNKNIPIVALISSKDNSNLIDYPLATNSVYFYTIYFFNKLLFKIISLSKL